MWGSGVAHNSNSYCDDDRKKQHLEGQLQLNQSQTSNTGSLEGQLEWNQSQIQKQEV